MKKVEISKLKRVMNLAQSKFLKDEGCFDSLDNAFEVIDTYKTISKYDDCVRYFMVDFLFQEDIFKETEYTIVTENGLEYVAPVDTVSITVTS